MAAYTVTSILFTIPGIHHKSRSWYFVVILFFLKNVKRKFYIFFTLQGLVQFYKNSDRLSLLNIDQRQRMYSFNDVDNKTKWCFFLITILFLSTGGEMKRIGTYDMKRKVIVVDKSQTAQWEGTAQMSSRLW